MVDWPNFLKTIDFFKSLIAIGITTIQVKNTKVRKLAGSTKIGFITPNIFHINNDMKTHNTEKPKTIIGQINDFQK